MSHEPTADASPSASDTAAGDDPGGSSRRGWRGRSREWQAVAGLLRAAEGGRGGVLLVEGPSGMGKSRLLREAIDAAAERGFVLARGTADEPSRLRPLEPLMSALGESPQSLREAGAGVHSEAIDVRLWLVEQLQARLEERVGRGPVLITLDDLHWAGPTTLLALRSLIPELASYPLVWILSRTLTGVSEPGMDRLYDVLEHDGATRIGLDALDSGAMAEVVADVLGAAPDPALLALAAEAGGNPYLLVELFEGLQDEGGVAVADGRARLISRQVPLRIQAIVRGRLSRLSAHTRHLLQVAAVLGRSFSVDDLAEMLGRSTGELLPALEEAEAAAVVIPAGDLLTFRHHLLWRAVTETISEPIRLALHRQAGAMLLNRGGSAIPAAAHLMRYVRQGDSHALAGLDRAVGEVLASSPQTAADLAVRALELTLPADPGRFDRTVTAVYALTAGGRLSEASELARTVLDQTTEPGQAARLRYELSYVLMLAGHPAEAVAEAEKVLTEHDLPDELRDLAEHVVFRGLFVGFDYARGRERAEEVLTGGAGRSHSAVVGAHTLLTHIAWTEGRAADAIGHTREAARIANAGPIRVQHSHPRLDLAALLTNLRRLDEAETVLRAADDEITTLGHTAHAANPSLFRARLRLAADRLEDAAAEAEAGLAMADDLGVRAYVLLGISVLAIVAVRRGDLDTAARHVEHYEAQHQAGQGVMYGNVWGNWAMAMVAEAGGGAQRARETFGTPYTDARKRRWLLMVEADAAAWLTRVALAAGDRSGAETVTATAEHLARGNPDFPTLAASAAHAHGILRDDATALARAAASYLGAWSRASAAEDLGVLLARTAGDGGSGHEAAVRSLEQALDGYQRTGALRDAARIRARLRELGVRRRHWTSAERPDSGWASLTDTERKVTALVARGLTNPQIATQMFISSHTVKFHLRQVFRKLGIGSRVELARLATEHSPDPMAIDT
ncbi:helix-turn-helix transcriptional regulator [Actinomadura scrupuli]|uniref:helix-turn-helix transcriptional regulator n=1 Tax=Actinomadura scrupuli TaxID=559629 RepID=UPI003D980F4F